MARLLNAGLLPPGYYLVPLLDRDGPIQIDIAAVEEFETAGLRTERSPVVFSEKSVALLPPDPGLRLPRSSPAIARGLRCPSRRSILTHEN
jgi:hypothetical protein